MEVGGAETLVRQLCHWQRDQGHVPQVYAVAALGALGATMREEGFRVEANIGRHLPDAALGFFRAFRRFRPDVVHLHNPTPSIYAGMAARFTGASSIVSTRHSLVAPPWNKNMERKYALAAHSCDWVVGICDATTENLRAMGSVAERKLTRVYNGSQPVRPSPGHLLTRGFTFLYVGRLEPIKNHQLLLEAFGAALEAEPELQLWMVGDGSERDRLARICVSLGIQDNVRFWGQQLDVAPFFTAADVFVMSSLSEGLPMSLLQAFSAGLPAIVTETGGMAEVVRLANAGLTVPLTCPDAMRDAMLTMARSPFANEQFSRAGESAFRAHFTLDAMAEAYMQLYVTTPRFRRSGGRSGRGLR